MNQNLQKKGKKIVNFDSSVCNFHDLIFDDFNNFIKKEHNEDIKDLDQIHLINDIQFDLEKLRQRMFSLFRSNKFQKIFYSLGRDIIERYFDENALIQKTPTARIQPPRFMTTSFHCDGWYGHSPETTSFWLPITNVRKENTLHMAIDRKESLKTLKRLQENDFDLMKINEISESICEPVLIKYGQMIAFTPDMIHGAKLNTSGDTRITFDFRIIKSKDFLGYKSISNYHEYSYLVGFNKHPSEENEKKNILTGKKLKFLSYSNSCKGVNAKSQLTLCAGIASDRNIDIIRNESEIYIFEHLPVLRHYLSSKEKGIAGVIVFSTDIFEDNVDLANTILDIAITNKKQLLFAAEDILVNSHIDKEKVLLNLSVKN